MLRPVLAALTLAAVVVPATAQTPGAHDLTRVAAGRYATDPAHTQVAWSIDHLGFTTYDGIFGGATGTLTLDPARPAATAVDVTVPVSGLVTTVPALDTHLKSPDFFDAARYPTVTFHSTAVTVRGDTATITGDLTLHGVTRPVTLAARFVGAGINPLSKKATVGFSATTTLNRSDYGIKTLLPILGDTVTLRINAAFERT